MGNILFNSKRYKIPNKHIVFTKPILLFSLALILSTLSCYGYHEQNPLSTMLAMRYFTYFILFFVFLSFGIKKELAIKTFIVGCLIYMIVFSLQLLIYPKQIIPFPQDMEFDRGFLRIRLEGVGFVTLTAFYSLNKFLLNRKAIKYLLLFFLCFIFVFILGFRTLLLTFLFSSLLLILINSGSPKKILVVIIPICLFTAALWQVAFVQDFINTSIETTEEHSELGEDYIRLRTYDFLFNEVNVDFGSLFFGNGAAVEGTKYGDLVLVKGAKNNGFISADLGLLGFVFNYGILSLLALLNIYRIAIVKKVPKDSIYLKIFFIYLIISSFTTAEVFRAGMFGVQMIALYLVTLTSFTNKLKKIKLYE